MSNFIHETAIIDSNAKIGNDNFIGPYCIVGPNVKIGNNNRFEAFVSIGTSAEHRDYFREKPGNVIIGDENIIRESVTINAGTSDTTILDSKIIMLRGSHIGHDAHIESSVTLSCNVLIGGHSIISTNANIGLGTCVHQYRVVGAYSMIGMNSSITRDALPFLVSYGIPAEPQRVNTIGLRRSGLEDVALIVFEKWFINIKSYYMENTELKHDYKCYLDSFYSRSKYLENKRVNLNTSS